jgi:uncharacterized protein (DUF2147 family)
MYTKIKTKRSVKAIVLILITSTVLRGQSVEGTWITYNEQTGSPLSFVKIEKSGSSIQGKVAKIFLEPYQGADPLCSKCTGERKDKKVLGMNFLWDFKAHGSSWTEGKILDPESGKIYSAKIWLEDANTLQVRGYAGPLNLFYRTQTWRRDRTSDDRTPVGTWQTIDERWNEIKSIVEIKNVDGELQGFIRRIFLLPHEGTNPVCTECDGALKNAKIVGMKIIWDFKKEGDKWTDGKILDPGNGHIYSSSLWLIDSDTLAVRGYLGPFYRSQVWKRAK